MGRLPTAGSTTPWASVLEWVKRSKQAECQQPSLSRLPGTADAVWPAAQASASLASAPWWTESSAQTLELHVPHSLLSNPTLLCSNENQLQYQSTKDPSSCSPTCPCTHLASVHFVVVFSAESLIRHPSCCIFPTLFLGESNPLKNPGKQPAGHPIGQAPGSASGPCFQRGQHRQSACPSSKVKPEAWEGVSCPDSPGSGYIAPVVSEKSLGSFPRQ